MNYKKVSVVLLLMLACVSLFAAQDISISNGFVKLYNGSGLKGFMNTGGWKNLVMIGVGFGLLYLGVEKKFEPLILVPMAFGAILSNIPFAGFMEAQGILRYIYDIGIKTGVFPLLIFMGIGAMTDFGPLIANPKTLFLGAAAQFGIFFALLGALLLPAIPSIGFTGFDLSAAGSIGIIGGADGPTSIFVTSKLKPELLGPIAVVAYSYMALVPIIQPPLMHLFTTKEERMIKMQTLRPVKKLEKVLFPLILLSLCALFLPSATPLIGMIAFGNLLKECGVVDRLSKAAQNELMNIVTIFLGLGVGSKLAAENFLNFNTIGILILGLVAFMVGTSAGLLLGKLMCKLSGGKVNPLIGAAGVSAVPMAARVANKVGQMENKSNFLLMHAMGPNVAGVIGSAVAAGVLLALI